MAQSVISLDTTIGGAATNSYLSLADANELIHARPYHDEWDAGALTDDEKKAALIWSTRILSHLRWQGTIADVDQALPWPRSGVYDHDSRAYSTSAYPEWLKVACAELAFYLIKEDRLSDTGMEGFEKIKIGSIELTADMSTKAGWIPDYIMGAIYPWLLQQSRHNAPVLRV